MSSEADAAAAARYRYLKLKQAQTPPTPETASADAIMESAATQAAAPNLPPATPESGLEDFGEGLGVSGLKTYYGIKDLVSEVDDEDRATLADWREDASESGWGTAGEVVGDVGQIIGTGGVGGAAIKGGLKLASNVARNAKAPRQIRGGLVGARNLVTPFTADIGAAATIAGTQIPNAGEDRGDAAYGAAKDALVGGVLTKALNKGFHGIRKTPEAQEMLDHGIPLTPALASEGTGVRGMENVMQVLPILAKGRDEARRKAQEQWSLKVMQTAAPSNVTLRGNARARARQLKDGFNNAYTTAWGKAEKPHYLDIVDMQNVLAKTGTFIGKDGEGALRKVSHDLKKLSKDFSPKAVKNLDHVLKKNIRSAARAGDSALEEGLNTVRVSLRNTLPATAQRELKQLDQKYGAYLVVKKAGAKAKNTEGMFTSKQLMDSVGAVGGEARTFVGAAPLQKYADAAKKTVGREEPAILPDFTKGVFVRTPTHQGTMDFGGRLTLGETVGQKLGQKIIASPVADALRNAGLRGGPLNVGYEKTQKEQE